MARICLLGRSSSTATGIDRYSRNLIQALSSLGGHEYYTTFSSPPQGVTSIDSLMPRSGNQIVRGIHNSVILPLRMRKYHFDIMHGLTGWLPAFSGGAKKILTVHDITPLLFPSFHTPSEVRSFRFVVSGSIKRSERIITDSVHTKNDLVRSMGVKEDKITVVPLGVEHDKFMKMDRNTIDQVRKKYSLPEKFLLYVGTIEPRKNVLGLLKAMKDVELPLVVAGKKGWKYEPVFSYLENADLKKRVIFLDYLPEEDLPALYNLATTFVYPSLYEGFGFPPLEAMACGLPVITSNRSSIPEVVGDAALMVDPDDTAALSKTILNVLADESLRKELSAKGIARAKSFTWEATARKTVQVYEEMKR